MKMTFGDENNPHMLTYMKQKSFLLLLKEDYSKALPILKELLRLYGPLIEKKDMAPLDIMKNYA